MGADVQVLTCFFSSAALRLTRTFFVGNTQDLYIMKEPKFDNTRYFYNGQYRNYTMLPQIINVKGGEPVTIMVFCCWALISVILYDAGA